MLSKAQLSEACRVRIQALQGVSLLTLDQAYGQMQKQAFMSPK